MTSWATLACFPNMFALERMADITRRSDLLTWQRLKIRARIESRIEHALQGWVRPRGSQNLSEGYAGCPAKNLPSNLLLSTIKNSLYGPVFARIRRFSCHNAKNEAPGSLLRP